MTGKDQPIKFKVLGNIQVKNPTPDLSPTPGKRVSNNKPQN